VFNTEFLHIIRDHEIERVIELLRPGSRILELGGGTGYQARKLANKGFDIISIDLPAHLNKEDLEFPVREYDGQKLPFPDQYFNIVYSSNVLEHIANLDQIHAECRRVLKRNGYMVHVMPTGSWRFWTNVAHYIEMLQRIMLELYSFWKSKEQFTWRSTLNVFTNVSGIIRHYLIVPRHGEFGNALTEILRFSPLRWRWHFYKQGFRIVRSEKMGLFYTGHMVLGKRCPLHIRRKLARILGSACVIFVVATPAM
jgi:2-polyprenyl-3-methyl-5-hydroxy-6-metoxy-1,4-benzoquinol methylase